MTASVPIRHFGAHPDKPDSRDRMYNPPAMLLKSRPASIDWRPHCPPVYDQRPLHSCTANAAAAAVQYERLRHGHTHDFVPSRLFIYYNERKLLGTEDKDDGAPMREAIKVLAKEGDCPEPHWPYDAAKVSVRPDPKCYQEAVPYPGMSYERLDQKLSHMQACLASGQVFMFSIGMYSGCETSEAAKANTMPTPKAGETFLGNHAVLAVGYDDTRERLILRNSWGAKWGDQGYFYLPYDYAANPKYAGDLWTLKLQD